MPPPKYSCSSYLLTLAGRSIHSLAGHVRHAAPAAEVPFTENRRRSHHIKVEAHRDRLAGAGGDQALRLPGPQSPLQTVDVARGRRLLLGIPEELERGPHSVVGRPVEGVAAELHLHARARRIARPDELLRGGLSRAVAE